MTFTRYKLIIGGENDFSLYSPLSYEDLQFFTNLKEEDFFFSSRTQHGSPITQNILTVEFMQVATRQQHLEIHSQNGTLYIYQSLPREARKDVYFFQNTKTGTKFIGLRTYVLQMAISAVFSPCFQLWGLAQFVKLSTAT